MPKNKYISLFNELQKPDDLETKPNDKVLVIDGLNTFIRCFAVNPSTNDDGIHIGGIVGFLKSIGYAIKTHNPTRCVIVFDGKGGSQRRRKIFPDYKEKRRVNTRFNRTNDFSSFEDEQQSLRMQITRLLGYLNTLPLTTLMIENVEADDVMAYIAKSVLKDSKMILMSTDKDFIQLVSDRISVWSPTKKKMYNPEMVFEEYGIPAHNFVMYRVVDGDKSDCIPGVKGWGKKTLIKKVPTILEDKVMTPQDLIDNGLDEDIVKLNYDLMQLDDVDISGASKLKIQNIINEKVDQLVKIDFQKMVIEDKLNSAFPNLDVWLAETFNRINVIAGNQ